MTLDTLCVFFSLTVMLS